MRIRPLQLPFLPAIADVVIVSPFAGTDRWYSVAEYIAKGGSNSALPVNFLWAMPFAIMRGGTLSGIAFSVSVAGGAGSVGRCGIYRAISPTNAAPGNLVVDGGEFDCTITGDKVTAISTMLERGVLYWATYHCGVAAPTVRVPLDSTPRILGAASGLVGADPGIAMARAYGALPASFPALNAGAFGSVTAKVLVRYSA